MSTNTSRRKSGSSSVSFFFLPPSEASSFTHSASLGRAATAAGGTANPASFGRRASGRTRGVYKLEDLPAGHRAEIQTLIDAAHARNLIGLLDAKLGDNKRGMIFFKWYGKDIPGSVDVPEYHADFKYLRTVGVSIFNKKQSTGKHYGPLRVTLRVLYNINPVDDPNVYIEVGSKVHRWRDDPLFIFDDTLQHQSVNESDAVRYCLFVDILRPTPWRPVLAGS